MTWAIAGAAALGGILLFLLAAASANTPLFAEHYPLLLGLNVAIAVGLSGLLIFQLVRLARQRRHREFGSLLTFRLVLLFSLMAVVPGALVYTVSVQFLAKSIESWFDVRVEKALESGLNLGRAALDVMLSDLVLKAGAVSLDLADVPPAQQPMAIGRAREQIGVEDIALLSTGGRLLASASREAGRLIPPMPSADALRQARQRRGYGAVEALGEKGLLLRVIVPVASLSVSGESRLLQLTQSVPQPLAEHGESVQSVYRAYRELSLSRSELRNVYILTLTLTLLLALFSAIALAFLLSRRLSQPLGVLAEGTQAVARGDFSVRVNVTSRDEFGVLTQSFNSMTGQLDEARSAAEATRVQLETAKTFLESILANLSAGVLVFDRQRILRTANHAAGDILREDLDAVCGIALPRWDRLQAFAQMLAEAFDVGAGAPWQRQIGLSDQVVLLRGSMLPEAGGGGYVVVFDDITQLIAAQRAIAWGEVARRLAHEIKNPLTPIQLSAERLQAKLGDRLAPEDAQALNRATETIVAQVHALKTMVDEFRDYARLPAPAFAPLEVNQLLTEVLGLYEHIGLRVEAALQPDLPPVRADRDQIRQVLHNLLRNALDAQSGEGPARVEVGTSLDAAGAQVWLTVADRGCGFPDAILQRAFEPYVSSKPKGTGLGLAIVKKIIDEHGGSITLANRHPGDAPGAIVRIALPLVGAR